MCVYIYVCNYFLHSYVISHVTRLSSIIKFFVLYYIVLYCIVLYCIGAKSSAKYIYILFLITERCVKLLLGQLPVKSIKLRSYLISFFFLISYQ